MYNLILQTLYICLAIFCSQNKYNTDKFITFTILSLIAIIFHTLFQIIYYLLNLEFYNII
jgi:hypothetical protein